MFDFRLKVFHTVAKRLNFTKAAEELYISQPAVTKHIKEIEQYYKVKIFDRNGSKIKLTAPGETLLKYTEQLFEVYSKIDFELNTFTQSWSGTLRIGASSTVAQYILPALLAAFRASFPDIKITLTTGNTEQIEHALQHGSIDLGLVEGKSKNNDFKYTPFIKDELVLVVNASHPLANKNSIKSEELLKHPFLLREPGSGTLEVIAHSLKEVGIKLADLHVEMQLGSSESIKMYVLNSNAIAFLSVYAIYKELKYKECSIVDVRGLRIERDFLFIQTQGDTLSLSVMFMRFANSYNLK
ncbi:LysR family transcriptional regulator [Sphingobacterium sp. MYb382]|uniref:LysR family transcriptional regulator n=1 Tax=Sphingobacterium sp. MYb382 TaxID=2745278 RepID=UPI0030AF2F8F